MDQRLSCSSWEVSLTHRATGYKRVAAARVDVDLHSLYDPSAGKAGLDENIHGDEPGHVGEGARDVGCASTRCQAIRLPPAERGEAEEGIA